MWRRQVLPRYPHSSAGAYGQATEQCKPRKCRADYYGRPSAIFRVKRSQVRSFLTSVWQNVRTKQAPCHAPILTSACALLTTPILPRGRKIVRLTMTWLWGSRKWRLGSEQEAKAPPSKPEYVHKMAGSAWMRAPDNDVAVLWYGQKWPTVAIRCVATRAEQVKLR